ncbi:GNAT family N-acetyltransferase [uncultured Croceitalea sp.]|uniref:GNAT family N-acetyltransferase n=1 Tax=uncultured Croceitalea sp. TaxID=1798908 RepID=UPI0033056E30
MAIEFKRCELEDLEVLAKISRKTFAKAFEADNHPDDFKVYLDKAFSRAKLKDELLHQHTVFYFVLHKGRTIGYFKVNEFDAQSEFQESEGLELERIYVISESQGKGFGLQIVDEVFQIAIEKAKRYVWLGVWQQNPGAVRFYEAYGFVKTGTHPYYIGKDKQTDWIMRKNIPYENT